jgi:hypothetical protein
VRVDGSFVHYLLMLGVFSQKVLLVYEHQSSLYSTKVVCIFSMQRLGIILYFEKKSLYITKFKNHIDWFQKYENNSRLCQ